MVSIRYTNLVSPWSQLYTLSTRLLKYLARVLSLLIDNSESSIQNSAEFATFIQSRSRMKFCLLWCCVAIYQRTSTAGNKDCTQQVGSWHHLAGLHGPEHTGTDPAPWVLPQPDLPVLLWSTLQDRLSGWHCGHLCQSQWPTSWWKMWKREP